MTHINLQCSLMRTREFMHSTNEALGIWLKLIDYCTTQENGGFIHDSRDWTEADWQRAAGVSLNDVKHSAEIWRWSGNHLRVIGYNTVYEAEIRFRRKAGKKGAQKRWKKTAVSSVKNGSPIGLVNGSANGRANRSGNA